MSAEKQSLGNDYYKESENSSWFSETNGEKRAQDAENLVERNLESFAKKLAKNLGSHLTGNLLDKFEKLKKEKGDKCTDSALWQEALTDVYHESRQEIPQEVNDILTNICNCLSIYNKQAGKLKDLAVMLKACSSIKEISNTTDKMSDEEVNIQASTFGIRPSNCHNWGRQC